MSNVSKLIACTVCGGTQATYVLHGGGHLPDSSRAATGDSTGSIVLLAIPTGEQPAVFRCDCGLYLDPLQFSPSGGFLTVGTAGKITNDQVATLSTLRSWKSHLVHLKKQWPGTSVPS